MSRFCLLFCLFSLFATAAYANCRNITGTGVYENLITARHYAKTNRNLKAIRLFGRKRVCGHSRHVVNCNRAYIKRNVGCRLETRKNFRTVYVCTATGTMCSFERRPRERYYGPQGQTRPFIPYFQR